MAIVVPFSKPQVSAMIGSGVTPPATDPFLLMSAAQMNADRKNKNADKETSRNVLGR